MKLFPYLSDIPVNMMGMALFGAAYGIVFKVEPRWAACAFAMRPLALGILFAVVNPLFGGDLGVRSLKAYHATHSLVAMVNIMMFRRLEIIAAGGTCVLAAVELCLMAARITTIHQMEI